ncbi:radical SAM protein [Ideonella sp. B508-1]|uniref:B12-binding domain-containing radical SAM protein n=1 Tax=Ideonella sp. B508-1 TaxID=137716 RepID=UPI0011D265A4|nr:radical SAM protein [Ideonella sp. B508-1]
MTYDLFDLDKNYVKSFCEEMIAADLGVTWECRCRIELLDAETVSLMRRAGCHHVLFGIESGSKRTLKAIKKTTNMIKLRERIEGVTSGGLLPIFSFVVGFPEEAPEDVDETLSLGLYCKLVGDSFVNLHMPTALPGTELWLQSKERLVLSNMTGDMANGVSFSAGTGLLEEDMERIKRHPDLFSTFYNIDPPLLGIDRVFFVHRIWATLTNFLPATLYSYSRTVGSLWRLLDDYRNALTLEDRRRIEDFNRIIEYNLIIETFGEFLGAFLRNSKYSEWPLQSVFDHEITTYSIWRISKITGLRLPEAQINNNIERRKDVDGAFVICPDVKAIPMVHRVSHESVLEQDFERAPHLHLFVPVNKVDFAEYEVPLELEKFIIPASSGPEHFTAPVSIDPELTKS